MHGILPEGITEALEYSDIDYEGLLPRLLQERPQRPRSSGAPAGARGEEGEQSSGGSNKPDDDSKAAAKKPGSAESKEDEDEEYPDHCGDLATFVEGRQIIEWVSHQYERCRLANRKHRRAFSNSHSHLEAKLVRMSLFHALENLNMNTISDLPDSSLRFAP